MFLGEVIFIYKAISKERLKTEWLIFEKIHLGLNKRSSAQQEALHECVYYSFFFSLLFPRMLIMEFFISLKRTYQYNYFHQDRN